MNPRKAAPNWQRCVTSIFFSHRGVGSMGIIPTKEQDLEEVLALPGGHVLGETNGHCS
jgi:phosphoserine aminotransferase